MSIYSGFPTRKDETTYNKLLSRLLLLFQEHIIELLPSNPLAHNLVNSYSRILAKMKQYQEHKYLPPKFSELLKPLSNFLGVAMPKDDRIKQLESETEEINLFQNDKNKMQSNSLSKTRCRDLNMSVKEKKKSLFGSQADKSQREQTHIQINKDSFYETHERKLDKLNERYNKKIIQMNKQQQKLQLGEQKSNYRSQVERPMLPLPSAVMRTQIKYRIGTQNPQPKIIGGQNQDRLYKRMHSRELKRNNRTQGVQGDF